MNEDTSPAEVSQKTPRALFVHMLEEIHKTREQATYLPLKARALLAAHLAGDQFEAQKLVDVIQHEWNLI